MRRRAFLALLSGTGAWPLFASAQGRTTFARIGFLGLAPAALSKGRVDALREGLRDLGYVEGKNIALEFRWADGVAQMPILAAELVRINVDVIFAQSSTEVEAARQATRTIPIVFATHADPVGTGHVVSLSHPGGNTTGLTVLQTDLTAKGLEILRETVPQAMRFGVLFSLAAPGSRPALQAAEAAAKRLGVNLHTAPLRTVEDFALAFASLVRERVDAVLVAPSALTVRANPALLADLALKHRLPSMFGSRENVLAGGLMSYAPDLRDLTRLSAAYIDKILKGAKPSELPVEQASKYQLIVNMQVANALSLSIPPTLLARADEVIE